MSNKAKAKTPNLNPFRTPNLEEVREGVLLDEMKARHWKAQYETAYYFLEFEKILPEYKEVLDKKQKEEQELREKLVKEIEEKKSSDQLQNVGVESEPELSTETTEQELLRDEL